jgi:hypothetical protein
VSGLERDVAQLSVAGFPSRFAGRRGILPAGVPGCAVEHGKPALAIRGPLACREKRPCEERRELDQAVLNAAQAVDVAKSVKSAAALKSARIIARHALAALNQHIKEHVCKS